MVWMVLGRQTICLEAFFTAKNFIIICDMHNSCLFILSLSLFLAPLFADGASNTSASVSPFRVRKSK